VLIICPIHGEFWQRPADHLSGKTCLKCSYDIRTENQTFDNTIFITKCNEIHNHKYDYSKVKYKNSQSQVTIICPAHGEFIQFPKHHLRGHGCKLCYKSEGENSIESYLKSKSITYIREYTFDTCRSLLKYNFKLPFDFYLPTCNICIEYDGQQHYESREYFGGDDALHQTQTNDKIKTQYCITNNIKLIRIPYWEFKNIHTILEKEL